MPAIKRFQATPEGCVELSIKDVLIGGAVEVVIIAFAAGLLYRVWGIFFTLPRRQVILPYQTGVRVRNGQTLSLLAPGMYWATVKRPVLVCDMRPRPFQFQGISTKSADFVGLTVDVSGEIRVSDAAVAVMGAHDTITALYNLIREALDTAAGEQEVDGLRDSSQLSTRIKELLVPQIASLGYELSGFHCRVHFMSLPN